MRGKRIIASMIKFEVAHLYKSDDLSLLGARQLHGTDMCIRSSHLVAPIIRKECILKIA